MTKGLAYVGVLALLSGLLLATCVGSAWNMEVLTDQELAGITATWQKDKECPPNTKCEDDPTCDHSSWTCTLDASYVTTRGRRGVGGCGRTRPLVATAMRRRTVRNCVTRIVSGERAMSYRRLGDEA